MSTSPAEPRLSVGELLREATQTLRGAGSDTPRLDAELLLGHVLGAGRTTLLAEPAAAVSEPQAAAFRALTARRMSGEPVSYIRGLKEFYGLALSVDRRALIPRPETELLVELGIERVRRMLVEQPRPADSGPLLIWDVGTGSGAIAIALAVECRRRGYATDVRLRATDVSPAALSLALENAAAHAVADVIDFALADLTDLPGAPAVDLLLANLPYIPSATVPELPVAASFEPVAALDGGADGLAVIRRLIGQLPAALAPAGMALLEIGDDQPAALRAAVADTLSGWQMAIHDDLGGQPRAAELQRA